MLIRLLFSVEKQEKQVCKVGEIVWYYQHLSAKGGPFGRKFRFAPPVKRVFFFLLLFFAIA